MRASIVIPTFNRLDQLQTVVVAVQRQVRPPDTDLEVVVVDDGSSDGTSDWLETQIGNLGFMAIRQQNSGPARAPQPGSRGCLWRSHPLSRRRHRAPAGLARPSISKSIASSASSGPLAVLGYTSFSPDIDSPFLRFINEYGAQFGYLLIEDPRAVPFNFFYTSNISLPRSELVRLGGFREDFPAAAWEDIEFAYRAVGDGLKIHYQPQARTIHRHCIRPRTFCRRQRTSGRSAAIFATLHPELEEFLGLHTVPPESTPDFETTALRSVLCLLVELGEKVDGNRAASRVSGVSGSVLSGGPGRGIAFGIERR